MKKFIFIVLFSTSVLFAGHWTTSFKKDKMTGKQSAYAILDDISPTPAMTFPYTGTKANIVIGCDKTDEWIYVYFNKSPNLLGGDTESTYSRYELRLKYDKKIIQQYFDQEFGSKALYFEGSNYNIYLVRKSNTLLLELNWYGEGKVYFDFDLKGSKTAIDKIRNYCKNAK